MPTIQILTLKSQEHPSSCLHRLQHQRRHPRSSSYLNPSRQLLPNCLRFLIHQTMSAATTIIK